MKRIFVVFVLIFLSSCSYYSFVGEDKGVKGNLDNIYIESVTNSTSEPNLQVYLKKDLIDTFNLDSRISLAKSERLANGFLSVEIVNYNVEPISYSNSGLAIRYRCSIGVVLNLKNSKGKNILRQSLSDFEDYSASDSVSATEKAKNQISKDVLKNLADDIRNALFTGF